MSGTAFATTAHAVLAGDDILAGEKADGTKGHFTGAVLRSGITDGQAIAAGQIGEVLSADVASGSAVSMTTATAKTVVTLQLTPGIWLAWSTLGLLLQPTTTLSRIQGGINTTTDALPTAPNGGAYFAMMAPFAAGGVDIIPFGQRIFNVSTNTNIHSVLYTVFGTDTLTAYGSLRALRVG